MFFSFIIALIVKDFYDIFIQSHIKSWLHKYKIYVTRCDKNDKTEGINK